MARREIHRNKSYVYYYGNNHFFKRKILGSRLGKSELVKAISVINAMKKSKA